jgi:hypothetical protein
VTGVRFAKVRRLGRRCRPTALYGRLRPATEPRTAGLDLAMTIGWRGAEGRANDRNIRPPGTSSARRPVPAVRHDRGGSRKPPGRHGSAFQRSFARPSRATGLQVYVAGNRSFV